MAVLLTEYCNIFGGESGGGRMLGGLSSARPSRQWYCPTPSIGRFFMVCTHHHRGQIMPLCGKHFREFRTAVSFCPRCNSEPPGHKCGLKLTHVS